MPDGVSWGYGCSFWEEDGNGGGAFLAEEGLGSSQGESLRISGVTG